MPRQPAGGPSLGWSACVESLDMSGTARLWTPPAPVEGEVERMVLWTQVLTGLELDADGVARVLDAATWQKRRRRLDELGGPPLP